MKKTAEVSAIFRRDCLLSAYFITFVFKQVDYETEHPKRNRKAENRGIRPS